MRSFEPPPRQGQFVVWLEDRMPGLAKYLIDLDRWLRKLEVRFRRSSGLTLADQNSGLTQYATWDASTSYVENDVVTNPGTDAAGGDPSSNWPAMYVCIAEHNTTDHPGAESEPGVGTSWGTYWREIAYLMPDYRDIFDFDLGLTGSGDLIYLTYDEVAGFSGMTAADLVTATGGITGTVGTVDGGVPRADGTSGSVVQASNVLISDTDDVTGIADLTITGDLTTPCIVGQGSNVAIKVDTNDRRIFGHTAFISSGDIGAVDNMFIGTTEADSSVSLMGFPGTTAATSPAIVGLRSRGSSIGTMTQTAAGDWLFRMIGSRATSIGTFLSNCAIIFQHLGTSGSNGRIILAPGATTGSPVDVMYVDGFSTGTGRVSINGDLRIMEDTGAAQYLTITVAEALSADRTLSIVTGDADRTLTFTGNATIGSGSYSGTNTGDQNLFSTIAVSGQSNVVADSTSDTLTLVEGTNITITTDADTDSITISATGAGGTVDSVVATANQIDVDATDPANPVVSLSSTLLAPGTVTVGNTALHILDTDSSHDLIIAPGSNLTADRTLTVTTGDANRTLTISGNTTLSGGTHSGTNTGDQTITLTGDVTGSGTGSFAATIANDAVTYAKMQNVSATSRVLGRITAGSGDVEELTGANIATIANSSMDHGTLAGLSDNDHPQYVRSDTSDTVTGTLTFQTNPVILNNAIALQGKSSGGTARNLINVDASNNVNVGDTNLGGQVACEIGDASSFRVTEGGAICFIVSPATGTMANRITVTPATTTNRPSVSATGSDTNISLDIDAKGTGVIAFSGRTANISSSGHMRAAAGTVSAPGQSFDGDTDTGIYQTAVNEMRFATAGTFAALIDSSQVILFGKTSANFATAGQEFNGGGLVNITRDSNTPLRVNRTTNDGDVVGIGQDGTIEGAVQVSGTTVSIRGAHLSMLSQLPGTYFEKRPDIKRGTLMTMAGSKCQWYEETFPVLNAGAGVKRLDDGSPMIQKRVFNPTTEKVMHGGVVSECDNENAVQSEPSTTMGDQCLLGIFDAWHDDNEHELDDPWQYDFTVAIAGDFMVRMTGPCRRGDAWISNGDGTAVVVPDNAVMTLALLKAIKGKVTKDYLDIPHGVENPELVPVLIGGL